MRADYVAADQTRMEAAAIFDSYLPDALSRALDYAGEEGFVASLPQLLRARATAPYDNEIWNVRSFAANSEENVVKTRQGNHAVVVVHGGGIFASPERFRRLYHASTDRHSKLGFTGLFGAKISDAEAQGILDGRLPDGDEIPVYSFREMKNGLPGLPQRYAVVLDFDLARNASNGNAAFGALKDDPLMIVRAGGPEAAAAYLDKARERGTSAVMGSWHCLNDINPDQPQTRVLFLGGSEGGAETEGRRVLTDKERGYIGIWGTHYRMPIEAEYGIRGDTSMINPARYVAVAPRNGATSLRDLPFTPFERASQRTRGRHRHGRYQNGSGNHLRLACPDCLAAGLGVCGRRRLRGVSAAIAACPGERALRQHHLEYLVHLLHRGEAWSPRPKGATSSSSSMAAAFTPAPERFERTYRAEC